LAGSRRRRSHTNWHFSDAGNRFDSNSHSHSSRDRNPISPSFSRKVIRCRRCGARVVSNVKRCPYCSKSLLPFYRRMFFWLVFVILLAAITVYLLAFYRPQITVPSLPEQSAPVVIGRVDQNTLAELPIGTTIDNNNLLITVVSATPASTAADGQALTQVTVQFVNKSGNNQNLLSTQWLMQDANGKQKDCYSGKTASGDNVFSGIEAQQLAPGQTLNTSLYFAGNGLNSVIYLINPLKDGNANNSVSWKLP